MTTVDHRMAMLRSSKGCNHRTPRELVAALERIWPLEIDLAANSQDCCIVRDTYIPGDQFTLDRTEFNNVYLGPDHPIAAYQDSLIVPWHQVARTGFLNPPYSLKMYSDGIKAGIPRESLQWLRIENWAKKAYQESLRGFTTIGVFPYAPQTNWFRRYVMGHAKQRSPVQVGDGSCTYAVGWRGHAALDYWRIPHRVSYLTAEGGAQNNANVNTCIVHWGPNPGFVGPWVPSGRYWTYRERVA